VLEYGDTLSQKCTIHLQLLLNHSPLLRELFANATELRNAYQSVKSMRQKVKALVSSENSEATSMGTNGDRQVARVGLSTIASILKLILFFRLYT
jgi:hypothetical protein